MFELSNTLVVMHKHPPIPLSFPKGCCFGLKSLVVHPMYMDLHSLPWVGLLSHSSLFPNSVCVCVCVYYKELGDVILKCSSEDKVSWVCVF